MEKTLAQACRSAKMCSDIDMVNNKARHSIEKTINDVTEKPRKSTQANK